jgi:hypothetical protein
VCVCVLVCVCMCVHTCTNVCICVSMRVCVYASMCVHLLLYVFDIYIYSLFECFVFIVSAFTSVLHVEQLMPAEDRALYLHTGAPTAFPLPLSAFALLYRGSK